MDTTEGRKILGNISLQRGPGYLLDNLQNVLDALWKVSDDSSVVDRKLFDPHLKRLRRYFNDLGKKKCVRLTYACERGRPIARITLLERQLPSEQKSQATIATRRYAVTPEKKVAKPIIKEVLEIPPPPPQTLLFLDVPNLTGFVKNKDWRTGYRYLDISRIDWGTFLDISSEITNIGRENVVAFAYLRMPKEQCAIYKFSNACHTLRKIGFSVETREKKDIDPMMITDIMDPNILGFQKNRVVKIIVGSGDGDFAYPLKRVREIGRKSGTNVSTFTLSWTDTRLSKDLKRTVDNVIPIEKFLSRLDSKGAMMYEHNREKYEGARQ